MRHTTKPDLGLKPEAEIDQCDLEQGERGAAPAAAVVALPPLKEQVAAALPPTVSDN